MFTLFSELKICAHCYLIVNDIGYNHHHLDTSMTNLRVGL